MSNHYHLLISTPDENLDDAIGYLQTIVSKRVAELTGSSSFRFESRYKWTVIKKSSHYMSVIRYVYQNPIRAGICKYIRDYKFSSLNGQLGYSPFSFPIYTHDLQADFYLEPSELIEFEKWIEEPILESDLKQLRGALRRFEFKYSKNIARACKKVSGTCKKVAGTVQK